MSILNDIYRSGQSIWYDYISRDFIRSGEMKRLVDSGIRGMTSNPTIFEMAISGGSDYDDQIAELDKEGHSTAQIASALFVTDVQNACDLIRPVYNESNEQDGYISLEVSPYLADDTEGTLEEAIQLFKQVDRANLMIKIPATEAGIPAIRQTIAAGINVNVTLIFSRQQYRKVTDAFIRGLEDRNAKGEPVTGIKSVASLFVSRVDGMIDGLLEKISSDTGNNTKDLQGKAGLANARLIYHDFENFFDSESFATLEALGASRQRPLWASTSTKNPDYPDLLYVDNLIGPNTVNTVPPATLKAILDHGTSSSRLDQIDPKAEEDLFAKLNEAGVDTANVMDTLLAEGVSKFSASFDSLFEKIEEKRAKLREVESDR